MSEFSSTAIFPTFEQDKVVGKACQVSIGMPFDLKVILDSLITLYNKLLEFCFFVDRHMSASRPVFVFVGFPKKLLEFDLNSGLGKKCIPLFQCTRAAMRGITPFFHLVIKGI